MTSLRVKLSQLSAKKVPLVSLVLVAVVGMVVGVLAANLTINTASTTFTGTTGTLTTNTGTMTVVDNGLSIVSTVPGSTNTSATFFTSGNKPVYCGGGGGCVAFATGHWMDSLVFTDTQTDSTAHTVKITINSGGTAPGGATLVGPVTVTLTGPGVGGGTGTITVYLDLGTGNITAPLIVYVTST